MHQPPPKVAVHVYLARGQVECVIVLLEQHHLHLAAGDLERVTLGFLDQIPDGVVHPQRLAAQKLDVGQGDVHVSGDGEDAGGRDMHVGDVFVFAAQVVGPPVYRYAHRQLGIGQERAVNRQRAAGHLQIELGQPLDLDLAGAVEPRLAQRDDGRVAGQGDVQLAVAHDDHVSVPLAHQHALRVLDHQRVLIVEPQIGHVEADACHPTQPQTVRLDQQRRAFDDAAAKVGRQHQVDRLGGDAVVGKRRAGLCFEIERAGHHSKGIGDRAAKDRAGGDGKIGRHYRAATRRLQAQRRGRAGDLTGE